MTWKCGGCQCAGADEMYAVAKTKSGVWLFKQTVLVASVSLAAPTAMATVSVKHAFIAFKILQLSWRSFGLLMCLCVCVRLCVGVAFFACIVLVRVLAFQQRIRRISSIHTEWILQLNAHQCLARTHMSLLYFRELPLNGQTHTPIVRLMPIKLV